LIKGRIIIRPYNPNTKYKNQKIWRLLAGFLILNLKSWNSFADLFNVGAHFAQFFKVAQAIFIERFADQSLSGGLGEQVQTTGVEPL